MRTNLILVATDFSQTAQLAFERAHALAHQLGARLVLVHVGERSALRAAVKEGLLRPDATDEELREAVDELLRARLAEVIAGHRALDPPVELRLLHGDPASQIRDLAHELDADLLVVGMRGQSLAERVRATLLGSVAEALVHRAPCPVLVVQPDHGAPLEAEPIASA